MKVEVNERCQGHNRCLELAPDLFDIDDAGFASPVGDAVVPDGLQDAAERAAANCPERAVILSGS